MPTRVGTDASVGTDGIHRDGWKSHDSRFFLKGLSIRFEPIRREQIWRIFHLIHPLIERYHRKRGVPENFEATHLNLASSEKFLCALILDTPGALIWDTPHRIVVPGLQRQTLKSRQDGRFSSRYIVQN